MEALADGLGGLDTSRFRPLEEVRSGSYSYFAEGDLLLAKVTPCFENGKKAVATNLPTRIGFATSEVHVIRVRSNALDRRYLNYVFCSEHFRYVGVSSMTGAGGLRRVPEEAVLNYSLPVTDISTQRRIADFLDHETARIDQLIEKKQAFIRLLDEYETTYVSEVATTGLDPSVTRKDSGVAWFGCIPEHWRVGRLKHVAQLQTGPFGSQIHASDYTINGVPLVNPAQIQRGRIVPDPNVTVDFETFARLIRHRLRPGDIVCGRRGEIGRLAVVTEEDDGFLCGTGSIRVRPNAEVVPEYLACVLSLKGSRDYLVLQSVGSTMENLNTTILGNMPVLIPSLPEQHAIIKRISHFSDLVDRAVDAISRSLERLHELRSALITAAVTGEIDPDAWRKRGETDRQLEAIEAEVNE